LLLLLLLVVVVVVVVVVAVVVVLLLLLVLLRLFLWGAGGDRAHSLFSAFFSIFFFPLHRLLPLLLLSSPRVRREIIICFVWFTVRVCLVVVVVVVVVLVNSTQGKRLSSAAEIRKHAWFKGVHFALIRSQQPPLVPTLIAVS
jgi:hypothetical protein